MHLELACEGQGPESCANTHKIPAYNNKNYTSSYCMEPIGEKKETTSTSIRSRPIYIK